MTEQVTSADGTAISFESTGHGAPALVFVHGWLGNVRWWDAQRDHFASRHQVVTVDLAGHGRSGTTRTAWSIERYADDIRAVLDRVAAPSVVLVGHSMSGPNVLAAAAGRRDVVGVVLVDTMKDLDHVMTLEQAEPILAMYRTDFANTVRGPLRPYLYSSATPADVSDRLDREFLARSGEFAATALRPLYQGDPRALAAATTVPVRGIHADYSPTAPDNAKHFRDYAYVTIADSGHYPMLERPDAFNAALAAVLAAF